MKEYIGKDEIKRVVLFPEGKILTYEERLDLACSLIITLPKYSLETSGMRFPSLLTREVGKRCKAKWKRYRKWRAKQNG